MTIDEFRERLRGLPVKWELDYLTPMSEQRTALRTYLLGCPIAAVYGSGGTPFWGHAAELLGLSSADSWAIMLAADGRSACDPVLRAQLLEDCGITTP